MIKISEKIKSNIIKSSVVIILPIIVQILAYLLFPDLILEYTWRSYWGQINVNIMITFILMSIIFSVNIIKNKNHYFIFLPLIFLLFSLILYLPTLVDNIGFVYLFCMGWSIEFLYIGISLIPSSIILYYSRLVKFSLFKKK